MENTDGVATASSNTSNSSQKRPVQEADDSHRKRAKYTSTACNACKRCKCKCIRLNDDPKCQRCTTMHLACVVVPTAAQSAKEKQKEMEGSRIDESYFRQLSSDITSLRGQVSALTTTVASLMDRRSSVPGYSNHQTPAPETASPVTVHALPRTRAPREPRFIGPTRSAFSFHIAETSLTRMGMSTQRSNSIGLSSTASSREATLEPALQAPSPSPSSDADCLMEFSDTEAIRLVGIYQEEIACVHPIIQTKDLTENVGHILEMVRNPGRPSTGLTAIGRKDAHMLRLAIATAIIHETYGKNKISDRLVTTVEHDTVKISENEVELKDIQIMGMLSLYFCHTSEELFAWRAIGCAARQCLEIGLHRKQSLFDNFKDEQGRRLAIQVFWVVYELDRRWSFGTSLSFALNDRDIDPQLPEPGNEYPYLKCMVAYARLCSRVWEALPPYGSSLQLIPKETEDYLDFITQNWLLSIPQELQFKHPRLGLAPTTQPRQLHRLRTLLYLRGNYIRTLIHRHHALTPENIKTDMQSAHLVVDIAKDSIQILVHLNETSDIYVREQSIYHYYLLSALAVVLLAVCHAPHTFAEACRDPFVSAVELVKGFSSHSTASRRLWRSIRGLLPVVKSLWQRAETGVQDQHRPVISVNGSSEQASHPTSDPHQQVSSVPVDMTAFWASNQSGLEADFGSMPDIFDLSNDLLDLYDVFGSAAMHSLTLPDAAADHLGEQSVSLNKVVEEVSRHFQGLL